MKTTLILTLFLSISGAMAQDAAILTLTETIHDFGNLPKGAQCQHFFEFTNTGNVPLIISNVTTSCGCDVPFNWPKEPVLSGKKATIGYYYDSQRVGPINKTMTIHGNFTGGTAVVSVRGQIWSEFTLPEITIWPKNYFKANENMIPTEKNMRQIENLK
jgi:hypothetical protein